MSRMLNGLLFSLFLVLAVACGNNSPQSHNGHDHGTHEHVHHGEGVAFNSDYVCPMHCDGSGSEEAGKCPKCGMDYIALAEHIEDGHSHE